MKKQTLYRYTITVDVQFKPRKLADALVNTPDLYGHLISVKDEQCDTHVYGHTYVVYDGRINEP